MPYHRLSPLNQFVVAIPPYVSYCIREKLPDDNELKQESVMLLEDARFIRYLQEHIGVAVSREIKGAFWLPGGRFGSIVLKILLSPVRLIMSVLRPKP
jgi:hypothetical protein